LPITTNADSMKDLVFARLGSFRCGREQCSRSARPGIRHTEHVREIALRLQADDPKPRQPLPEGYRRAIEEVFAVSRGKRQMAVTAKKPRADQAVPGLPIAHALVSCLTVTDQASK